MTTLSGKKKVPLPNIQISDMIPYTIVHQDVKNPMITFSQAVEKQEIPFIPPRQFTDHPSPNKKNQNNT